MAKKEKLDYSALVRGLREKGPDSVYLLWGAEDYLREQFFREIKSLCLDGSADDFNHKRIDGPGIDMGRLADAVDSVPMLAERTLVELRGLDINKCRDADTQALKRIISDMPDYCTLVIVLDTGYEPDGRLAAFKAVKKHGNAVEFTAQDQSQLIRWIQRRFSSSGKSIGHNEAAHLIFTCGPLMSTLIPEIEKLSDYIGGRDVAIADIDNVVIRVPEADVFEMTEHLSAQRYDKAFAVLSDLIAKKEHPIMLIAIIGQQLRRLYTVRVALDAGMDSGRIMQLCDIRFDFIMKRLISGAGGFTARRLSRAVRQCARADYEMKSSSKDDTAILIDFIAGLSAGGAGA